MMPSREPCLRRGSLPLWIPVLGLLLLSGCSAAPRTCDEAFSASQQVKGNSDSVPASLDVTWQGAMEVLAQQGFLIQQADATSRVILASCELHDADDDERTYTVAATLTLVPASERLTRVMLAANQTTELHTHAHTWWHLLWLIPLFPTGTEYTTVVVDRDTVQSPQFYQDFFDAVKASCAGRSASAAVAASP